ncbi:MAG: tail fiber domain-containing protein [Candidatus Dadabacteria bacterium]|nr:tail fiber domain-containing protein [Candidatus Dadabacteria bacterium]
MFIDGAFSDAVYINIGENRAIGVFNGGALFMGYNTYYDTASNSYEYAITAPAAAIEWDGGGNIKFVTKASGTAGVEFTADTRMIIQNDGNVGIGTSTPDSIKLDVEDDIEIGTGTTGCVRDADNTTLTGSCVSDERLKRNIESFPSILDKLSLLRPVTFEWRNDEYDWLNGQEGINYGLIAQEVEEVFPEMVQLDDRGYKRVSYDIAFSMRLLQGIKELDLHIKSLASLDVLEDGSFAGIFFTNLFICFTSIP